MDQGKYAINRLTTTAAYRLPIGECPLLLSSVCQCRRTPSWFSLLSNAIQIAFHAQKQTIIADSRARIYITLVFQLILGQ